MLIDTFAGLSPVLQALVAGVFTWSITALGASVVFLTRTVNQRLLDGMMGFAAGVMIAASIWSLLLPSITLAGDSGLIPWVPAAVGFASGWIFLWVLHRVVPHLHIGFSDAKGPKSSLNRTTLLVIAITLHNIPEGLAIGVAFGAVAAGISTAELAGAIALTIGIGIQNFPEGLAISMPLRREGMSRPRSLLVRAAFSRGRAGCGRRGSGSGDHRTPDPPVRPRIRRRGDDLCRDRRGDPRVAGARVRRPGNLGVPYRLSRDDDPRCRLQLKPGGSGDSEALVSTGGPVRCEEWNFQKSHIFCPGFPFR